MANTFNLQIPDTDVWTEAPNVSNGVFTTSNMCQVSIGETKPNDDFYGHRILGNAIEPFMLEGDEKLFFKSTSKTTVVITGV